MLTSCTCPSSLLPTSIVSSPRPIKLKIPWRWLAINTLVVASTLAVLAGQRIGLSGSIFGGLSTTSSAGSIGGGGGGIDSFVTRQRDRLMLDGQPFRFVSFNAPDLHVVEDNSWHPVTTWEQSDALQTINRMGGRVVRIYPFSVAGGLNNGTYTHIEGPGQYNERLFRDLDRLLVLARQNNVRIIIPLIDNWSWWGGVAQFAALYGVDFTGFYTNPTVISAFNDFVRFLLERVNPETGIKYKDDSSILGWETGNELDYDDVKEGVPTSAAMDAWTANLASLLKSLDPNHLVFDGRLVKSRDVSASALADPNIDVISDHFYPNQPDTFEGRLEHLLAFTRGKKPFIVGEFGLVMPDTMDSFLAKIQSEASVTGALLWSLRSHNYKGGFYWHYEYDNYWAYHYPGFESNSVDGERDVMSIMRDYSFSIQGKPVPPTTAPSQPSLIGTSTTRAISWRGAVGARFYRLERQAAATEPWAVVATNLSDSDNPFVPYNDATAQPGQAYTYRIIAVNEAGASAPSEAVHIGPPQGAP